MPTRVLPDANVLHARTLRDWLLLLKDTLVAENPHDVCAGKSDTSPRAVADTWISLAR